MREFYIRTVFHPSQGYYSTEKEVSLGLLGVCLLLPLTGNLREQQIQNTTQESPATQSGLSLRLTLQPISRLTQPAGKVISPGVFSLFLRHGPTLKVTGDGSLSLHVHDDHDRTFTGQG